MDIVLPQELRLRGLYVSDTLHLKGLPTLDTHELAWAAGFFDGEGGTYAQVHTDRGRPRVALRCSVAQANQCPIERLMHVVPGVGRLEYYDKRPGSLGHSGIWRLDVAGWRDVQRVLGVLWPYLCAPKREQAAAAFLIYQQDIDQHPGRGRTHAGKLAWGENTCPQGHTDIVTYVTTTGQVKRRCRICRNAFQRALYQRKKEYRRATRLGTE